MATSSTSVSPEIASLSVLDSNGIAHEFSSLYISDNQNQQTLFVFIRHFFCGSCKDYVCALCEENGITPDELSSANKRLIIIGCGQPNLIEQYKKDTNCSFEIYVDPNRQLYEALGMIRSLSLGDRKPDYIKSSMLSTIAKSLVSAFSAGSAMFQGGDVQQIGGEYLINASGNILWSHNMTNTRDHVEVQELRQILSLDRKTNSNNQLFSSL